MFAYATNEITKEPFFLFGGTELKMNKDMFRLQKLL